MINKIMNKIYKARYKRVSNKLDEVVMQIEARSEQLAALYMDEIEECGTIDVEDPKVTKMVNKLYEKEKKWRIYK